MTRHANRAARALLALATALASALIAAGPVAAATPATAFGDGSTWRAIVNGPSGPDPAAGWEQPGFDDASWPELRGPFGNEDGSCGSATASRRRHNRSYRALPSRSSTRIQAVVVCGVRGAAGPRLAA